METCHPIVAKKAQGDVLTQSLRLPAGAVRAFDPRAARRLRCVDGLIWVTQEGNAADTILSAGDRFVPAPHGRIVVQALSVAVVGIP